MFSPLAKAAKRGDVIRVKHLLTAGADPNEAARSAPDASMPLWVRHRPDRILVGEVRGPEAFDLLQALNTGHLGSLTTIHANSAEQALTRLAHCVLTANVGLPHRSIREAIALAIHLVVHVARVDGQRRVTQIVRVREYDGPADTFRLEPYVPHQPARAGSVERALLTKS